MYQKDYILRMIEMIADLVAGILGLIREGRLTQASQTLDNAYQEFLKKDASLFRNIPAEKLTETLLSEHNYTGGHLRILSELYFAEAELQLAKGKNKNSLEYYQKALVLFEFAEKVARSFSVDTQSRISVIKEKISHLKQPAP
ncbi:MAG: hypothetical protein JXR52_11445 [Bacteroidales bacterium]|nr:hypothetical protein [Bacteroidales bacterium]MBN2699428.1 hypothetical protein [Bacteroidales bacterium]